MVQDSETLAHTGVFLDNFSRYRKAPEIGMPAVIIGT